MVFKRLSMLGKIYSHLLFRSEVRRKPSPQGTFDASAFILERGGKLGFLRLDAIPRMVRVAHAASSLTVYVGGSSWNRSYSR